MPGWDLTTHVRDHMVAAGYGRDPYVAGAAHPIWRDPRLGARAPRQFSVPAKPDDEKVEVWTDDDLVVSLFRTAGRPVPRNSSYGRWRNVEFVIRSRNAPLALQYDATKIQPLFLDRQDYSLAGALWVLDSQQVRDLQSVEANEQAYTFSTEYEFLVLAASD